MTIGPSQSSNCKTGVPHPPPLGRLLVASGGLPADCIVRPTRILLNSCSTAHHGVVMKKACMRLPTGVVWTITYIENRDGTVFISNFDKEDNDGYMFANTLPVLQSVRERDPESRIAEDITVDGVTYAISNPQNVYTYKQPL